LADVMELAVTKHYDVMDAPPPSGLN
jgi:hypothetical protein